MEDGKLFGRTDVAIAAPDRAIIERTRQALGDCTAPVLFSSPARRCLQTAQCLFPDQDLTVIDALWEQDFGDWEGRPYASLPDIGELDTQSLAQYRPPNGESFLDLSERVQGAIDRIVHETSSKAVIVAHAGSIRAALGIARGNPASGLETAIDHLSLTWITKSAEDRFAVGAVNERPEV